MLLGTFVPKLDEKGRIILPAKFADDFASGIVMARGQEHAIYVYSQREFEDLVERMQKQAPSLGKKGRDWAGIPGGPSVGVPVTTRVSPLVGAHSTSFPQRSGGLWREVE